MRWSGRKKRATRSRRIPMTWRRRLRQKEKRAASQPKRRRQLRRRLRKSVCIRNTPRPEEDDGATWENGAASGEGGIISVPEPAIPALVEVVGSEDALEELPQRHKRRWRHYKIQEVIKRNQIVLIQVVKEERGSKGAALTTYLSLAGRYTVLMPNTASGGGISRKITVPADRKRLKEIAQELEVPEGMGLIIRTAGASRTKAEIKRDFEYLLRLWENVRDLTLEIDRALPRLRGRRSDQALHPRPLQ